LAAAFGSESLNYPKTMKIKKDKTKGANQRLETEIKDGVITITIGTNTYCDGVLRSPTGIPHKLSDFAAFARDAVYEMGREEEDGETLITKMMDDAANNAVDQGSEGVDFDSENNADDE
jgi:hypothetical protein